MASNSRSQKHTNITKSLREPETKNERIEKMMNDESDQL